MKLRLYLFLILLSNSLFAQINFAKPSDFKDFLNTKTLVILDANPFSLYNETIKNAVETYWKITPYEFVSAKEFNAKKNNKNFSFLMLTDAALEQKGISMQYNMLNLILGGKAKNLNEMPDLGSVPLSYTETAEDDYLYKIGGVLQFMQFFINYNLNNPNTDIFKLMKNIDGNIGNKEIWLIKEEADNEINTVDKIKKIYSGTVRFVNKEDIVEAIKNKDQKVVFLHKIGNQKKGSICWKFLIDAATGKPLYFNQHKIDQSHSDAFGADDLEKIKNK